jgi:hypothetical protein
VLAEVPDGVYELVVDPGGRIVYTTTSAVRGRLELRAFGAGMRARKWGTVSTCSQIDDISPVGVVAYRETVWDRTHLCEFRATDVSLVDSSTGERRTLDYPHGPEDAVETSFSADGALLLVQHYQAEQERRVLSVYDVRTLHQVWSSNAAEAVDLPSPPGTVVVRYVAADGCDSATLVVTVDGSAPDRCWDGNELDALEIQSVGVSPDGQHAAWVRRLAGAQHVVVAPLSDLAHPRDLGEVGFRNATAHWIGDDLVRLTGQERGQVSSRRVSTGELTGSYKKYLFGWYA